MRIYTVLPLWYDSEEINKNDVKSFKDYAEAVLYGDSLDAEYTIQENELI